MSSSIALRIHRGDTFVFVPLRLAKYSLGRHRDCEIQSSLPTVSRFHAEIVFRDGAWFIQNLSVLNGTLINSKNIGADPVKLEIGNAIQLGDWFIFVVEPAEIPEALDSKTEPASPTTGDDPA